MDEARLMMQALVLGTALTALSLLLTGGLYLLRLKIRRDTRRRERFLAVWKPLILASMVEPPSRLPPIRKADWPTFLSYWNQLYESVRGTSQESLVDLARAVGADRVARSMALRGRLGLRLLAIQTLGNMQDRDAWGLLEEAAQDPGAALSVMAVRALMQIDPEAALPLALPLIATRTDWSLARIGTLLHMQDHERMAAALAEAALTASPEAALRYLRLIEPLRALGVHPLISRLLAQAQAPELLAACLRMVATRADRDRVRALLAHAEAGVRAEAAACLGRLGEEEDIDRLLASLDDEVWQVRFQAAHALVQLPCLSRDALRDLPATLGGGEGSEILTQVLAERGIR